MGRADLEAGFDAFVVCAGAWIGEFVPLPVRVTLQTVAYVQASVEGPVWIEDSPELAYGFPSDATGLKMGVHRQGPEYDPEQAERTPLPDDLEIIRDAARRRFGVAEPELEGATGCLYTNAPTKTSSSAASASAASSLPRAAATASSSALGSAVCWPTSWRGATGRKTILD